MKYFSKNMQFLNDMNIGFNDKLTIDGAISNEYDKCNPKIMWILREPHGGGGGSLIEYVKNLSNPYENKYRNWGSTYSVISKVTYGILNNYIPWGEWIYNVPELLKSLSKIAIINLNKLGGGAKNNWHLFMQKAIQQKMIIKQQIFLLQPNVIICGGTFFFLSENEIVEGVTLNNKSAGKCRDTIIIDTYHPAQTKITHRVYYEMVVDGIKSILPNRDILNK